MNRKKWLVSDPGYLATIGFMSLFNYLFDQYFRAAVSLNPILSLLYVFQYQLILPLIDIAFLSCFSFLLRRLRG